MGFADGQTLEKMTKASPESLVIALEDSQFQKGLGKILAADAFVKNPDRAAAAIGTPDNLKEPEKLKTLRGWLNPGSLTIGQARRQVRGHCY